MHDGSENGRYPVLTMQSPGKAVSFPVDTNGYPEDLQKVNFFFFFFFFFLSG